MERGFEQWKPREVARLLALVETDRRYYQEVLAAVPVAIAILSGDRTIVSGNRAFRRRLGLRNEDLREKTIEQVLPSEELIERVRAAHVAGATEPFMMSVEGRPFRISLEPIRSWQDDTCIE